MRANLLAKCLLTGYLVACGAAHAQTAGRILVDPMRPANMTEAAPAAGRGSGASGTGVQIVLTSPERKLALIDGKVVPLGGDARGGTLVGLSESSAVLSKDGSRDVLLMHPSIDKRPPSSAPRR